MKPSPIIPILLFIPLILSVRADLLVHYPFNGEGGSTVTNKGSKNNGTLVGGATYGASKEVTFGQAFYGNRTGANDGYVQTGLTGTELGMGPNSVYTAMAWVKWSGASGQVDHMVFGQEDGPGNSSQLHHGIRADSTANVHYGGWGNDLNDAGTVPIDEWTHVAWSYDGNDKIVFVNGVETSRGAGGTMAGHALPVIIGGHGRDAADPAGQSFNGAIDEVKVFNEVLTAAQIQAEMPPGAAATDTDSDGLSDNDETNIHGTDPNDPDSDNDGINDGDEIIHGFDPNSNLGDNGASGDPDGDSVTNIDEINTTGTDPNDADSDDDNLNDGDEITANSDPLNPDSDGDTLRDGAEVKIHNTNPTRADSDGDGYNDNLEITANSDPNNAADIPATPPVDGPLVYYSFNKENGTDVENLGSLLTPGTLSGAATFGAGKDESFGSAFSGNRTGANDAYIQTGYTGTELGFGPDSVYTAMAWVNWSGPSGQVDHMVFGQEDGPGNSSQLHHGIRADSDANVHYGGWGNDLNDAGTVPVGQWTHVAWSYDGSDKIVFVNGVETSRGAGSTMAGHALPVIVGGHGRDAADPAGQSFNGLIDEVKIYDRVLDSEELQLAMSPLPIGPKIVSFSPNAQIIPTGSPLTLSWNIDSELTSLSIEPDIGDVLGVTNNGVGKITLDPGPLSNTTYTLTAINTDGINTAEISLSVSELPIMEFFNSDQIIVAPDTPIQLNWKVINADSLSLNGTDITGASSINLAPSETTTWILSATNSKGTKTSEITVTVVIPGEPAISEVSTSNSSLIDDEDGDSPDWIEIYNPSGTAAILNGYYLTDDPKDLRKWRIPNMVLPSGELLIIFASNKNRAVAGAELHTNFSLSSNGEYLALSKEDGADTHILSEFNPLAAQSNNTSWGVFPDGLTQGYFTSPTPGLANNTGFVGFVRDTKFSSKRGFYDAPFEVTISSNTDGAKIRYTTDGSTPTTGRGNLYTDPIGISATTTLRAIAYKTGYISTNVDTNTYIFPEDVVNQTRMRDSVTQSETFGPQMIDSLKSVPTISIVTENPGSFLNEGGAVIRSESPASVEMIFPDGTPGFQENGGLKHFGGYYTNFPKKSIRIGFRSKYGATKMNYPLFEGFDYKHYPPTDRFDVMDLRSGSHDMVNRGAYMSNRFTDDSMLDMGNLAPHGRFVHVYLNGNYWGQYHLRERWNADMASSYFGGPKADYDVVNLNDNFRADEKVYDGTGVFWNEAKALASGPNPWENNDNNIDVANLIDFMLLWVSGNSESEVRLLGSKAQGQPFRFQMKDADGYLRNPGHSANDAGPLSLMSRLRSGNTDFAMLLADRIHKHYFNDGAMTPAKNIERLQKRVDEARPGFIAESARWGNRFREYQDWLNYQNNLVSNHFPGLAQTMVGRFKSAGMYPDIIAPVFNQHGGSISDDTPLTMSTDADKIYYTLDGSDPRLNGGDPNPAATEASFNGGGGPGDQQPVTYMTTGYTWKYIDNGSDQGTEWRAIDFNDTAWSSGPSPLGYGGDGEATELSFGGDSGNKYATTYYRTTIEIPNPAVFLNFLLRVKYDDGAAVYINGVEQFRQNLGNNASFNDYANGTTSDESGWKDATIPVSALVSGTNIIAVEVHQASGTSSDTRMDLTLRGQTTNVGGGDNVTSPFTISKPTLLRARGYNSTSGEWSALNEAFFTIDSVPADANNLVVSEFHYRPAKPTTTAELAVSSDRDDFEFLELLNVGESALDMNEVRFSSGINFSFPENVSLGIEERILLLRDRAAFEARYGQPSVQFFEYTGRLSNDGEQILILGTGPDPIKDFTYNDQEPWPATADGEGPSLVLVDPTSNPNHNEPNNWMSSQNKGGSPGSEEPSGLTYDTWAASFDLQGGPLDDDDGDQLLNFFEFLHGSSPIDSSDAPGPVASVQSIEVDGSTDNYLTLTFNENSGIRGSLTVEVSTDLKNWSGDPSLTEVVSRIDNGNETSTITVRIASPIGTDQDKTYLRLRGR